MFAILMVLSSTLGKKTYYPKSNSYSLSQFLNEETNKYTRLAYLSSSVNSWVKSLDPFKLKD